ncbi:protein of unknown function [Sulfitobacter brevis]|uniref:YjiS-like domain-containing protein n=1 Tax=Sulfitobacter brevis TaxID=74348 RepID=A0A1I1UYX6_9RHOB|nr:DUF1127 domain-containing protein [Sulfitobacter brevis]SFD75884.1 protein of unknown function [Sulfitobacter brevis]
MTQVMTNTPDAFGVLNQRGLPVLAVLALKFAVCLTTWTTRRRTRLALQQLDAWQLADVGLTPDLASQEATRVFWRA